MDNMNDTSTRPKLKQYQITLLELYALNKDFDVPYRPDHIKRRLGGLDQGAHIAHQHARKKQRRTALWRRIDYLKKHHYLEVERESEEHLVRLTSKAKFEILKLQFAIHMQEQRKKPWDGNFYLSVFDVPEHMKNYRDLFRRLLRNNGFRFLQLSVWMTRYNPHPAIDELLTYLGLEKHFEIMKISCKECSPRLQWKISRG